MRSEPSCRRPLFRLILRILVLTALTAAVLILSVGPAAAQISCPSCNDFNACTLDSCDTSTGTCRHDPRSCDDGNPCTNDVCNPGSGCTYSLRPAGTACDDHNSCTQNDVCSGSATSGCAGTLLPAGSACDDGNACTHDESCDASGACGGGVSLAAGSACNDGNPCTTGDTCTQQPDGSVACQSGAATTCNDGNACTVDSCDPATGQCVSSPLSCDDGNVCTADSCDPATGCQRTFVSGPCDDGNYCTLNDACTAGNCIGPTPRDCGDFISCTDDICDPLGGGICRHNFNDSNCNDGNECTSDLCVQTGCAHPHRPGQCTGSDRCFTWGCIGSVCTRIMQVNCNDGNSCTTDSCDASTGCLHQPITGSITCGVGACQRTIGCDNGGQQVCTPGTPSTEVCNGIDDDCDGQVDELGTTTCGLGACQRTVQNCLNGTPQTCVPGTPTTEVCNGIDDDCDGLVDENRVFAECTPGQDTLNLNSQGSIFSITCRLTDLCDPAHPEPIDGSTVAQTYISRADSAASSSDDRIFPDPNTLPCPDPVLGALYERGIVEGGRDNTPHGFTSKFNVPGDGICSTLDGDRQDLSALLTGIPDSTQAIICLSGKASGADFTGCVQVTIKNKGLR